MPGGIGLLCLLVVNLSGCSQSQTTLPNEPGPRDRLMGWPKDWSGHVGEAVTLEGTAADGNLGGLLQGEGGSIWIDGLEAWPQGFYFGGDQGKRLRVTGTVIKKDDLPVFVQRPGEPTRAGIPVHSEEEREKAK